MDLAVSSFSKDCSLFDMDKRGTFSEKNCKITQERSWQEKMHFSFWVSKIQYLRWPVFLKQNVFLGEKTKNVSAWMDLEKRNEFVKHWGDKIRQKIWSKNEAESQHLKRWPSSAIRKPGKNLSSWEFFLV